MKKYLYELTNEELGENINKIEVQRLDWMEEEDE